MPELKSFPVFGESGRIGTLSAPARFLDNRTEKVIQLVEGGEIVVPSASLKVQPDGSFFLQDFGGQTATKPAAVEQVRAPEPVPVSRPSAIQDTKPTAPKLYREGYSIEHVKIDRLIDDPVSQRQEGDTLILPVVEEVLVTEKQMMLREEIRITRSREELKEARIDDLGSHQKT